jgi:hypothetical protein
MYLRNQCLSLPGIFDATLCDKVVKQIKEVGYKIKIFLKIWFHKIYCEAKVYLSYIIFKNVLTTVSRNQIRRAFVWQEPNQVKRSF